MVIGGGRINYDKFKLIPFSSISTPVVVVVRCRIRKRSEKVHLHNPIIIDKPIIIIDGKDVAKDDIHFALQALNGKQWKRGLACMNRIDIEGMCSQNIYFIIIHNFLRVKPKNGERVVTLITGK